MCIYLLISFAEILKKHIPIYSFKIFRNNTNNNNCINNSNKYIHININLYK